jgi:hypothetical protein
MQPAPLQQQIPVNTRVPSPQAPTPAPAKQDIESLTREMERLRIQNRGPPATYSEFHKIYGGRLT